MNGDKYPEAPSAWVLHYLHALAVLFASLTLAPKPAAAATTQAWLHRYSNIVSNATDEAFLVLRDAAGDIIVSGTTDEIDPHPGMLTIKYSGADGTVLWKNCYHDSANGRDVPRALGVDESGNVVVTGHCCSGTPDEQDFAVKYSAGSGTILWDNHYPTPANHYQGASMVDSRGNVVLTGSFDTRTNGWESYLARYSSSSGTLIWKTREPNCGMGLMADSNGDLLSNVSAPSGPSGRSRNAGMLL